MCDASPILVSVPTYIYPARYSIVSRRPARPSHAAAGVAAGGGGGRCGWAAHLHLLPHNSVRQGGGPPQPLL